MIHQVVDYGMYIAGEWGESSGAARFAVYSPVTGARIGSVPEGNRTDVQRAMTAAHTAFRTWSARTPFDRASILELAAQILNQRRETLAQMLTLEQGKPLFSEALVEVDDVIRYFRMAAADAMRIEGAVLPSADPHKRVLVQRMPRGVVGLITPWNWPYEMPVEVIAPALAVGNTVVWSPAPSTSICAALLTECLVEAGLPPGVINLVTGFGKVVGDEIAGHPLVSTVAFIGSTTTGHQVATKAAGKELLLEMGGNGPVVILDDAHLESAATATLTSCLLCAGQSCSAGEVVMVQRSVLAAFQEHLLHALTQNFCLGDPFLQTTTLGPLNNEAVAAKMDRHIADACSQGARVLVGGQRASGFPTHLYYEPTVLTNVRPEMLVAREETFGPIIPLIAINDESDALNWIDASEYGLMTSIFTRDVGRALRFAEDARSGWVNINESTNWWEIHLPFGGRAGSRSGIGRVGGRFVYERLTETKTIVLNLK